MTTAAELHVQAAVWTSHNQRYAALFMEGEAPDRANGGAPLVDALYSVALARGLRMTTDPGQLGLRPVPGWRIRVAPSGAITLEWPHFTPLLAETPVTLPDGWRDVATDTGVVLVFAGRGLGLHEHAGDGVAHAARHLRAAAEDGMLAGGAVTLAGSEAAASELDGTVSRPWRTPRHRPAEAGSFTGRHRREPTQRWWSGRIHGHHHRI